jgi:hypothetical protein
MFEPVTEMINAHATNLYGRLSEIVEHLGTVVDNTAADVARNTWRLVSGNENTGEQETAIVTLTPLVGRAWLVRQVAVTSGEVAEKGGKCAVYLNAIAPENLLDFLSPASIAAHKVHYYVPEDSKLIFHFYQQPKKQVCTANVQVEEFEKPAPREATTGHSGERSEPNRTSPIPSGHPFVDTELLEPDGNAQ